eukprot:3270313-Prymnesium_polylepis.1
MNRFRNARPSAAEYRPLNKSSKPRSPPPPVNSSLTRVHDEAELQRQRQKSGSPPPPPRRR